MRTRSARTPAQPPSRAHANKARSGSGPTALPAGTDEEVLLSLQRQAGNLAVREFLERGTCSSLTVQRQGRGGHECAESFHPELGRVVDPVAAKPSHFFIAPYRAAERGDLGHIYFRTSMYHFPVLAEPGANRLIDYMLHHRQRPLYLRFVGHADWRAGCTFNERLAHARSRSVASYFRDRLLPTYGGDFTYDTLSLGEQISEQADLAEHRRVDVIYFGHAPPRHDFEEEDVPGEVPERFSRDFEFRIVGGAQAGMIGGLLWIELEIRNIRNGDVDRFVYRGFIMKLGKPGPFGAPVLPSGPHSVRTRNRLALEDSYGAGSVHRLSVGGVQGENVLYFYGPQGRRRTDQPIVISLPGGRLPGAAFSKGRWSAE